MVGIEPHSKIQRKSTYLETELDDETIVMQIKTGRISSMAETGRAIWIRLSEPICFGDLIDDLVDEFEVERDTCATEVGGFLIELEKHGFVEIASA